MASTGKKSKSNKGRTATANGTVTSAREWRKSTGEAAFTVPLPSGNVVKLRRIPLTSLLSEGLFPDAMIKTITDKIAEVKPQDHKKKKGAKTEDDSTASLTKDLLPDGDLTTMFKVMDKIAVFCVVEPKLTLHFTERKEVREQDGDTITDTFYDIIPFDERDVEALYTDEVDDMDKMEIFSFAIGAESNLKTFRPGQSPALADVPDQQGVLLPAE